MKAKCALLMLMGLASAAVHAECECRCVGGQNRPLCSNSIDLPPICPPMVCPIEPPSVPPILAPQVPPIGTSNCEMRQVLNPYTRQYQWQRVCQ